MLCYAMLCYAGIFQARVLEWGAIASSFKKKNLRGGKKVLDNPQNRKVPPGKQVCLGKSGTVKGSSLF